jgi:hypothetical protein
VLNLADYGRIRVMADRLGVESIDREGLRVVLKFRPQARLDPVRLVSLVRRRPDLMLVPPAALRMDLSRPQDAGGPGASPIARGSRPPVAAPSRGARGAPRAQVAPSWWVARARAGEVKPGFNKEAILRPAKANPREPGGVFEQVGGLLSELLEK